jgi:hypothetical protein
MTLKLVTTVFLLGLFTMMPPADAANVSKDQALSIAQNVLAEDTTHDLVILKDRTVERPFGWVFFYAPRRYAETGDKQYLLPGTAPLVVLRASGATEYLPTSIPPSRAIEIFEKRWEERVNQPKSDKK